MLITSDMLQTQRRITIECDGYDGHICTNARRLTIVETMLPFENISPRYSEFSLDAAIQACLPTCMEQKLKNYIAY